MKVKSANEIENENKKKSIIDFFKKIFDIKKDVKNVKIYSGSIEIFDSEKYFNKKNTLVNSE